LSYDETDEHLTEYAAGVEWYATVARSEAKTFPGIFFFRGAACRLTNEKTLAFLDQEFSDGRPRELPDVSAWLEAVLARLKLTGRFANVPDKATKYYVDIKTAIPGVHYSLARKTQSFKVGLYFETADSILNRRLFEAVQSQVLTIEAKMGFILEWRNEPNMKRCCIELERPIERGERPLRDLAVMALIDLDDACSEPLSELATIAENWK